MDQQRKISLDETEPGICYLGCFNDHNLRKAISKPESLKTIREILALFRTKSKKLLKKEYVRTHIIRLFKKAVREVFSSKKLSKKTLKQFESLSPSQIKAYERFTTFIKDYKENLENLVSTEAGPITDGKSKRVTLVKTIAKSFNDNFIKEYFSKSIVRDSFSYFIDYIFAKEDSSELVNSLKYFCCFELEHDEKCTSKWLRLKEFYQVIMIEELNIVDNLHSCDGCYESDFQYTFFDYSYHDERVIEDFEDVLD
ncbi:hypothetical protein SteCoe_3353 [Stentor coeruleus]|uniref:Uncharacterized protein n=1 Tax=Stentor coeruleus TaxID=5963 RepID=A0A1R2CXC3_9CILI|nr:hypothetical protein SteCoe_3353 [Stentor coeruleus]